MSLTERFMKMVYQLKTDVFRDDGLPTLKLKDEIRAIILELRDFESKVNEDHVQKVKR